MAVNVDHDENLRIAGRRRAFAKRSFDAATAGCKLAVIMAYRNGVAKQRIAHIAKLSLGTVTHWVEGVERLVPGDSE